MTDDFPTATPIARQTLDRAALTALLATGLAAPLRFEHCAFDGADLSRLDLRGAQFLDCSFAETLFDKAILAETLWHGCKARQARFQMADLSDAHFARCDLNNTDWSRGKLASTRFSEVKLTGAHFGGAHSLGLSFHHSLLVGADLRGISFRKQRIEQLDLSDADVSGCDFRDAVFEAGSLRDAHLKNAQFDGADLRSVDLSGLRIAGLAQFFKGAIISPDQASALITELGVRVI